MSFLLSFKATIADRVAKLSEIPAAILPIVVPLAGQITYASNLAEPDADFAARFWFSSSLIPCLSAKSSGVIPHSSLRLIAPSLVTVRKMSQPASTSASIRRTEYCEPDAPVIATTADGMVVGFDLVTSKVALHPSSWVSASQSLSYCSM